MKKFVVTLLILMQAWLVFSQVPSMRHYGVDDGLPSSLVYNAMQDSKGFIWLYTDKGVARFDGYRFEVFTVKDGLPYNDVWNMVEDSKKRIWLSSYAMYFAHYDYTDGKFHVTENKTKGKNKSGTLKGWVEDKNKNIWVNSSDEFYNITNNTLIKNEKIHIDEMLELYGRASAGFYWTSIGKIYHLNSLDNKAMVTKIDTLRYPPRTFSPTVGCTTRVIMLAPHYYLYYSGFNGGVLYFDSPYEHYTKSLTELGSLPVSNRTNVTFYPLSSKKFLVKTPTECFVVNTQLERLHEYDFLKKLVINVCFEDKEGNLWICTKDNGAYFVTQQALFSQTYTASKEYSSDIRAITQDKIGRIWLGTADGSVYQLSDSLKRYDIKQPDNTHILDMAVTPHNKLLIANNSYLITIPFSLTFRDKIETVEATLQQESACSTDTCKYSYFQLDSTKASHIFIRTKKLNFKKNGDLLMSQPSSMYFTYVEERPKDYEHVYINAWTRTYVVTEAKRNNFWLGTSVGLIHYDYSAKMRNELNSQKRQNPMLKSCILDMKSDRKGWVWVATDGRGLYRFHESDDFGSQIDKLEEIPALEDKTVSSIFVDTLDRVWAATNEGAFCISNGKVSTYTIVNGLPTNEVNCIYANKNYAYIGTSKGITKIPLFIEENKPHSLLPLYVNLTINNTKYNDKFSISLPYDSNKVHFSYVSLSYQSDKKIKYSYKMYVNGKLEVVDSSDIREQDFLQLKPGNYEFNIRATDINGNISEEKKYMIDIAPPIWKQGWFLISCAIGFLILGGAISYWVVKGWWTRDKLLNKIKENRLKDAIKLEKETTRSQAIIANLENKILLSQMNWHFMFNAITAIQGFVEKNNIPTASKYLAKYAKMVRMMLDSLRQNLISIESEARLLEYYLSLQHLRFPDKFTYKIEIDEEIDRSIQIPTMLLQPIVENAVKYGMEPLRSGGLVLVEFRQENENSILCRVSDNGIGREAARTLTKTRGASGSGVALKIIQERINCFKIDDGIEIYFDIKDNIPTGTIVEMLISI